MADILSELDNIQETIRSQGGGSEMDRLGSEAKNFALTAGAYGLGNLTCIGKADVENTVSRLENILEDQYKPSLPEGVALNPDIKYFDPASSTLSPTYDFTNNLRVGATLGQGGITDDSATYTTGLLGGELTASVKNMLTNAGFNPTATLRYTRSF